MPSYSCVENGHAEGSEQQLPSPRQKVVSMSGQRRHGGSELEGLDRKLLLGTMNLASSTSEFTIVFSFDSNAPSRLLNEVCANLAFVLLTCQQGEDTQHITVECDRVAKRQRL